MIDIVRLFAAVISSDLPCLVSQYCSDTRPSKLMQAQNVLYPVRRKGSEKTL
jgi:hypothetical protein